jgi:hypothetical protein
MRDQVACILQIAYKQKIGKSFPDTRGMGGELTKGGLRRPGRVFFVQ